VGTPLTKVTVAQNF